jgi:hypothetical protein
VIAVLFLCNDELIRLLVQCVIVRKAGSGLPLCLLADCQELLEV